MSVERINTSKEYEQYNLADPIEWLEYSLVDPSTWTELSLRIRLAAELDYDVENILTGFNENISTEDAIRIMQEWHVDCIALWKAYYKEDFNDSDGSTVQSSERDQGVGEPA